MDCYPQAEGWLADWQHHLATLCARWKIDNLRWVPDLSYHPVFFVEPVGVLKLFPPGPEASREIAALQGYNTAHACGVRASEPTLAAVLLERLTPGAPLKAMVASDDARATTIAAELMQNLWSATAQLRPEQKAQFTPLADWIGAFGRLRERFQGGTGPFDTTMIARAEAFYQEVQGMTPTVLLHGDLHHGNILSCEFRGYRAIDPKGLWGDAAYEVGSFLANPASFLQQAMHDGTLMLILKRRIAILSDVLAIPRPVITRWAYLYAVLSACWSFEDHGQPDAFALRLATHFLSLRH
jgi:streptomycin 6-kinase